MLWASENPLSVLYFVMGWRKQQLVWYANYHMKTKSYDIWAIDLQNFQTLQNEGVHFTTAAISKRIKLQKWAWSQNADHEKRFLKLS